MTCYPLQIYSFHPLCWPMGWTYQQLSLHVFDHLPFEPDIHLPNIVRATMAELFPEADNIFDGARLMRAGGTVNNKSGFYKTKINREDTDKASIIREG